mmetsp:Transcript_23936/g.66902  ORF Transcript_23936/g.66902 Transcript_23936/m.66902 type:complete len:192 (-) Transcript_23936:250-825(-)|eukprot:CAMPEP_0198108238 /NCGR_PEP_ID=MMETSP1442-20131203/300_1 /TAXON_ID= /ORGANISM="Craspedostauros australis, Strain CCMP3328" /LENGTH=191 /DNA_ID=CAMNT_0043763467 /DNA_START=148 /DNA_END=726 /DNA_ORIENTATION=-
MAVKATQRKVGAQRESNSRSSATATKQPLHATFPCGACCYCRDVCDDPSCADCDRSTPTNNNDNNNDNTITRSSSNSSSAPASPGVRIAPICGHEKHQAEYTMCEIRRHNTEDSCWLVAGDTIYDATTYISQHPGGSNSIIRKSGGACDCTTDLHFHSKSGRKLWNKYIVGKVKRCPSQGRADEKHWWVFW